MSRLFKFIRTEFLRATFLGLAMAFLSIPLTAQGETEGVDKVTQHNYQLWKDNSVQITASVPGARPMRPFAEYERAGFVLLSGSNNHETLEIKKTIARHLPKGVKLVLYSKDKALIQEFRDILGERLEVLPLTGGYWSRDALPYPVWLIGSGWGLVDARLSFYEWNEDSKFSHYFRTPLFTNPFYFEGGNLVSDAQGNCFIVEDIKEKFIRFRIFQEAYGCHTVTRLPYLKGIGHADERIKFLSDKVVLTDQPEYVELLKSKGYEVVMVPTPEQPTETYINSLLINGTVFVPVFGESKDSEALQVYRDQGLKVVPVMSRNLSRENEGSIHCISMTYPKR